MIGSSMRVLCGHRVTHGAHRVVASSEAGIRAVKRCEDAYRGEKEIWTNQYNHQCETGARMKKAGIAGFFHSRSEELLLHFFSSGLGCIGSVADCITSSLGGFGSSVSGCCSSVSGHVGSGSRSSSVSGRGGSVGGRSGSVGGRSSGFRGGSSGFGGRSRCFLRLRACSKSQGEQGGDEEGRFHFDFLG